MSCRKRKEKEINNLLPFSYYHPDFPKFPIEVISLEKTKTIQPLPEVSSMKAWKKDSKNDIWEEILVIRKP